MVPGPLGQYQKKRDFSKTSEPRGEGSAEPATGQRFVVQKHRARHLHYDLRLEMEGVLKSWAIPKGPSLNPEEKRLAIHVEDHPLEYFDFEGVIPRGEYGAGQVIVWDSGTYQCGGSETDPAKALRKGAIELHLRGTKLKGLWLLVRIKREENQWLFFKQQDAHADPQQDLLQEQPESVLSGLPIEEMVEGQSRTWNIRLRRLLEELNLPLKQIESNVRPMLATLASQVPSGKRWTYELKYDGYRALARKQASETQLISRNLKRLRQFPELVAELEALACNEFVLDGEIVALNQQGRSRFQLLQGRIDHGDAGRHDAVIRYMVFDVLGCEGYDLRGATLRDRRRVLKALIPRNSSIRLVEVLPGQGQEFWELVRSRGLEGIVAKQSSSTYQSRRTSGWLKIKCSHEKSFVVGGWTPASGGRRHFASLAVGRLEEGQLRFCGRVGSGFDERRLAEIQALLSPLETVKSPFKDTPKELAAARWVKPSLVCDVRFSEWTRDGMLRAPSFRGLRPDLTVQDCQDDPQARHPPVENESDPLEGYPFLSNPNKPFWPEEGYLKRDLVFYYHRIAPVLLPYLKDRPMNLERYPDGYMGKSFYQKDAPDFFPDWIRTVKIQTDSKERAVRYVVCDSRETLVYLANLACIPLHPWSSRVDSIDRPDFLIIDLDRSPGVPFSEVCRVALKVRDVLRQLGLESWSKTSGSRGLHVLAPLEPEQDYAAVRSFAEIVARLTVQGLEEIATLERNLLKRKGKIYLDFLQNGLGKTIVSPYCLRPRPGAPVSTPLEWNEIARAPRPDAFNLSNLFPRLERKGDLFRPVLTKKQSLRKALAGFDGLLDLPEH